MYNIGLKISLSKIIMKKKSKIEIELYERSIQMEKVLAITQEVEASFKFVELGLLNLREQKTLVSNNHVTIQLLSSGFERIIKILLLLKEKHLTGHYPKLFSGKSFFNKYRGGHGINVMLEELLEYSDDVEELSSNQLVREDVLFLKKDIKFKQLVHILTEFSIIQRYFYIDTIVMEKENSAINPFELFKDFLYSFLDGVDQETLTYEQADTLAIKNTIICIERGLRGISRFFIFGFADLGRQYYADFSNFILLKDENLGSMKYAERKVVPSDSYYPISWPSLKYFRLISFSKKKLLSSSNYKCWPFNVDSIYVFSTGEHFYLAEIGREIFALTGATSTYFKIPTYLKSKYLKPRGYATYLLDEAKKLNPNSKF